MSKVKCSVNTGYKLYKLDNKFLCGEEKKLVDDSLLLSGECESKRMGKSKFFHVSDI